MGDKEFSPFVDFGAGTSSSTSGQAETSNRSTTPPLSIEQRLELMQQEISVLKKNNNEVSMKPLPFSWENIPDFNPGKNDISINKWIRLVEEKAYFSRWDDVATTRFVVSKLENRAREWYLSGEFAHKSWAQLKTALRCTFDIDLSTTGLLFRDAALYSSEEHKTLVQYFSDKLNKLQRLNWEIPEGEKVNIIIHGLKNKDIKQMALVNNFQSCEDLLTYLRGCDLNLSDRPRSTQHFKMRCYQCNDTGHRSFNCPNKRFTEQRPTPRPNKHKVEAIIKLKSPSNKKELRQFCGLANYFRKFIINYAFIVQPITKLLKKHAVWCWSGEQEEAFELIKSILSEGPCLKIFDSNLPIQLHCDASSIGVAGILMQKHDNKFYPAAYFSKQCTYEQSRYHSYELETMAVVFSLKHFRTYLLGKHFTIYTDCAAVRATALKKDLVPRIARWWLEILDFNFDIEYRAGCKMGHVDYLSRHPVPDSQLVANITNLTESEWIVAVQMQDEEINNISQILQGDKNSLNKNFFDNYALKTNILYRKVNNSLKWVVPTSCRWLICRLNHDDAGHFAFEKTLERIRRNYWFKKMANFVKKYVSACLNCLYMKASSGRKPGFLHPIPKANVPFDTIHVDHLGPFVTSKHKNNHILVIADAFCKFLFIEPVKSTKVKYVINTLNNFIFLFGPPNRIISDRGTAFTSKKMASFWEEYGIKHIKNAVATPRANGQCERYNETILTSLRCYSANDEDETNWDSHLKLIQFSINSSINKTTGKSAYEVLMGINPRPIADAKILAEISDSLIRENLENLRAKVSQNIQDKQEKAKTAFDKKRKPPTKFKVNDLVMVRKTDTGTSGGPKKLMPKFKGPFRVIKRLDKDRYVVKDLRGSKQSTTIIAIDSLKSWVVLNDFESQPL